MMRTYILLFSGCLAACTALPLPQTFAAQEVKLIVYRNSQDIRIVPVARRVSEAQRRQWQNWLTEHRSAWQSGYGQTVSGATLWCVQWQQDGQTERICNRDGRTLVWLNRGLTVNQAAITSADAIWRPQPSLSGSLKPQPPQ